MPLYVTIRIRFFKKNFEIHIEEIVDRPSFESPDFMDVFTNQMPGTGFL